jgi:hypothetical protein
MKTDNFSNKARSRAGGKRCPECMTYTCFPLKFWGVVAPNRFICDCGRVVDRNGQRIKPRVLR